MLPFQSYLLVSTVTYKEFMEENICKRISYRGLFLKIYKEYLNLNNKEIKKLE